MLVTSLQRESKSPSVPQLYLPRKCLKAWEDRDYKAIFVVWFPYPTAIGKCTGIVVHCGNLVSPDEAFLGEFNHEWLNDGSLEELFVPLPPEFHINLRNG